MAYRVIGCDPGYANFGYTASTFQMKKSGLRTHINEIGMFTATLNNLTDKPQKPPKSKRKKKSPMMYAPLQEQLLIFEGFWSEVLDEFKPNAMVVERFQARGLKGKSIELVSIMNGLLASLCLQRGIKFYMITAATWKNQVNRYMNLIESYGEVDFPDHMVDSSFISVYGAVQHFNIKWDEVNLGAHVKELRTFEK